VGVPVAPGRELELRPERYARVLVRVRFDPHARDRVLGDDGAATFQISNRWVAEPSAST
jgi:hypothetical protein